jgi:SAM-dependent methyltransferase
MLAQRNEQAALCCPVCGRGGPRPYAQIGDFGVYRCRACHLCFSDALHRIDVTSLYGDEYFIAATVPTGYSDYHLLSQALARNAQRRLGRLERLAGGERTVLDVGCGTGEFLDVARRRGWQTTGVEISPYAAQYGRRHYGLDIRTGTLGGDLFAARSFAAVTLWDVIEHLPDPLATLGLCARLLDPGGVLALSTGDIGSLCARLCGRHWHLFNLPEHVFFFSRQTIHDVLRRAGFEVVSISYPRSYYPVGYLLERLYKSLMRNGKPTPRFRLRWLVPCNLFDVMEVLARPRS